LPPGEISEPRLVLYATRQWKRLPARSGCLRAALHERAVFAVSNFDDQGVKRC
jgi:hypothetical protein